MTPKTNQLQGQHLRILIIGKGGREHALAWKLAQSPLVDNIYIVPGNGGTTPVNSNKICNISNISEEDYLELVTLASKLKINLVVPGTDSSVVGGVEGYFRAVGISCFGPSKEAAQIEGSKTFSKDFMNRHSIPTAKYRHFDHYGSAKDYLDSVDCDVVLKVSGLAAGKGVILPKNKQEAHEALREMMLDRCFGDAGNQVIIEEFLEGEELSIHSFSDGVSFRSLPPAQDHKRIFDGDKGPNTGGMGCYAPAKISGKTITASLLGEIERDILKPTFEGLAREGIPFVGMLFTGVMVTSKGVKVLEYNARFGDPETQTLLPLLESDLAEVMAACVDKSLDKMDVKLNGKSCAAIVIASNGYPGKYPLGLVVKFDTLISNDTVIFHSGTKLHNGELQTSGGRVFTVSSTSESIEGAVKSAYVGVNTVHFDGMIYRNDIAHR